MIQIILLIVTFIAALAYLGRYLYKQVQSGNEETHCDKCLPKEAVKK